ncbi:MAG TPA: hypothetical protein PKD53_00290 [Chloroflexaceae bacterium]|nr:hypothetical protein [Chloroflexaceae bacterium]
MGERISWAADAELAALLRRYYQGEAELWPAIQARVHDEVRARGLTVGPRHMRFRRTDAGYEVILEGAEGFQQ